MIDLVILDRTKAGKWFHSTSKRNVITHILAFCDVGGVNQRAASGFYSHPAKKILIEADDCVEPEAGFTHPTEEHVQKIIDFANEIKRELNPPATTPATSATFKPITLVSHCYAGRSRSTAGAFVILSVLFGPGQEQEALAKVFEVRPIADPNPLIVSIADRLLDRRDAMTLALASRKATKLYSWP